MCPVAKRNGSGLYHCAKRARRAGSAGAVTEKHESDGRQMVVIQVDLDEMMRDFVQHAEAFISQPDFEKGIELHDMAARAGVACNTRMAGADRLGGQFHEFKRAIPAADTERLSQLLDGIKRAIESRQ